MMNRQQLYDVLDRRRRELNLTQAEVTERAFGRKNDTSAMQNVRRADTGFDKVQRIAEVLGLELYIGSPRGVGTESAPGLAEPAAMFRYDASPTEPWQSPNGSIPDTVFFLEVPRAFQAQLQARYVCADPTVPLEVGGLVCLQDQEGRVAIGKYLGIGSHEGWLRFSLSDGEMIDERPRFALKRVVTITWRGITKPNDNSSFSSSQKQRAIEDARRHLAYLEDLIEEK